MCDPPRNLAFTWAEDELHFDLDPVGSEHCQLTLTNVLHNRDAAVRNAAGWSVCLGELDQHIAGEQTDGPHSDSAAPWQPYYDAYLAAGLPSGAEIATTQVVEPRRHTLGTGRTDRVIAALEVGATGQPVRASGVAVSRSLHERAGRRLL